MVRILIILFFAVTLNMYSQAENCTNEIQKDFLDKIKGYNPIDLIPYNVASDDWKKKWGLMDKKTKKKLTKPFMNFASTFNPNISFFYKECDVEINSNYELNVEELTIEMTEGTSSNIPKINVLDSVNGYSGFRVDKEGNLSSYSKLYYRNKDYSWNISKPFFENNQYFAIVKNLNGNKVVIDTLGKINAKFIYKTIKLTQYNHNNEKLLYFEDLKGKRGFGTLSGKKLLYGELLKSPFFTNEVFGYSIQNDGVGKPHESISKSGILDLTTMKWVIKPKKGLKIIDMCYTSDKEIKTDALNRDKVNIYFVILRDDGIQYLIDVNGTKYLPK